MERPESCPAYLVRCTESFLEAIEEARTLALEGDVGDRLAGALHFASDLLDIIKDGLDGPESDATALDALNDMRDQVYALRGPFRARGDSSLAAGIALAVSRTRIERSAERLADLGLADRLELGMLLLDLAQLRAIARLHPIPRQRRPIAERVEQEAQTV